MTQGDEDTRVAICRRAIEVAGGHAALARQLGISVQAVFQWKIVPDRRVLAVETITGISRYDQRPDIYGANPLRKHNGDEVRVA